jgi:hypothetical protein
MNAAEVIEAVLRHRVLIRRDGDDLVLESPLGDRLPDTLVEMVRVCKQDVLSYLRWEERADMLVLDSTRRIGAAWPEGCSLDIAAWWQHERALQAAYHAGDLDRLEEVLRRREAFALELFDRYRKEVHR